MRMVSEWGKLVWMEGSCFKTCKSHMIADALHLMDEHKVADTIQRKYIISTTTTSTGGAVFLYMHNSSSLRCIVVAC